MRWEDVSKASIRPFGFCFKVDSLLSVLTMIMIIIVSIKLTIHITECCSRAEMVEL